MGVFNVDVSVGTPARADFRDVSMLVDTGASNTMLPASILRELGVTPHGTGRFMIANGQVVTRQIGRTWLRLEGQEEMTIVVFGDEGTPPILGAITLEELRLGVDPVAQKLIAVTGFLL
jgi:predicted aspartyl protease